jgi:hypothetical protein
MDGRLDPTRAGRSTSFVACPRSTAARASPLFTFVRRQYNDYCAGLQQGSPGGAGTEVRRAWVDTDIPHAITFCFQTCTHALAAVVVAVAGARGRAKHGAVADRIADGAAHHLCGVFGF